MQPGYFLIISCLKKLSLGKIGYRLTQNLVVA